MIQKVDLYLLVLRWEGFVLSSELEEHSSNRAAVLNWKLLIMTTLLAMLSTSYSQDEQYSSVHSDSFMQLSTVGLYHGFDHLHQVLEEEGRKTSHTFATVVFSFSHRSTVVRREVSWLAPCSGQDFSTSSFIPSLLQLWSWHIILFY